MNTNPCDASGNVTLVTGGNSGIGLGFARGAARAGSDIMIWGRRAESNRAAAEELGQYGVRVYTDTVDVSSEDCVVTGMQNAVNEMGKIDCIFANAGFAKPVNSFRELTDEQFRCLLDTNLHGAFYTLREGAKHMAARADAGEPGGSLVICGSSSILKGSPSMPHYGAAKGALAAMMKTIAVDMGKFGVRANMIIPGFIVTGMTTGGDYVDPENAKQLETRMAEAAPMGRVGYPEDFEGIGAYLSSDASSFQTGTMLIIDGGRSVT